MLTHTGTQPIETERLLLRRFTHGDNEAMRTYWVADEKLQALYSEPAYTTEEAVRSLLDKYIWAYKQADYYRWAIIEKENNACIGQIAYWLVDSKNHFAEIEYCIGSAFQCKGLATEAAKAVIAYGFRSIKLHKVQICHKSINLPSKRVIEKCGCKYEGTLRDYFYMPGLSTGDSAYIDRLYYSILNSEFLREELKEGAGEDYTILQITPALYHKCGNIWDMDKQPSAGKWLQEIEKGSRIPWAYTVGGEFLGEGALVLENEDPDYTIPGRRVYFSRLVVKQEYRGRGIGKTLVDFLCGQAKAMGYAEITIGVDKDNAPALHLYKAKGFTEVIFDGADEHGPYYKLLKKL